MMLNEYQLQEIKSTLVQKGIQVLLSFIILIIAHFIGRLTSNVFLKTQQSPGNEQEHVKKVQTIYVTFSQVIYYIIMTIAFMIVMSIFGIEIASIVALFGASGIAVGLALQGTLNDVASSMLLTIFDVYRIGEIIQLEDMIGRVKDFNLIHTIIEDIDSELTITVPNRKLKDEVITNYSRKPIFIAVIKLLVSNQNIDFPKIFRLLEVATSKTKDVISHKKIYVSSMNRAGTTITVKAAVHSKHFPDVVEDIQTNIREILAINDIKLIDVDILSA